MFKKIASQSSPAVLGACLTILTLLPAAAALAQIAGTTAPSNPPAFLMKAWQASLTSPLPKLKLGTIGAQVPQNELDLNFSGILGSYQPGGATVTANNAFFSSLGTNGRSCATCHQPASSMSINLTTIKARYVATSGGDPLFSPVDGANCPNLVPAANTSPSYLGKLMGHGSNFAAAHSLILNRGVFRIFLPVPAGAEYTVSVVSDPTTCNTDPNYNQVVDSTGIATQVVSVFRRPRISTNLLFVQQTIAATGNFPPIDPIDGSPLPFDPFTGLPESKNIMWDGREPTLQSQAIDATLGHAQALAPPTDAQVAQMVAFELGIFSAQSFDYLAGNLTASSALGGPVNVSSTLPGQATALAPVPKMVVYDGWSGITATSITTAMRASIYRGQEIFNNKTFTVTNVAGLSNIAAVGNNAVGTCGLCHNQINIGNDAAPAALHNIGVSGDSTLDSGPAAASDLPVFKLTCNGTASTVYHGQTILTNDPGLALVTGKCADIGRSTVPQLRGLAARAPYFHDGSAANLTAVVNFYAKRFNITYAAQEKTDLVNFLNAL